MDVNANDDDDDELLGEEDTDHLLKSCASGINTVDQHSVSVVDVGVYTRRWYILIVFSLVASTQGGVWMTWGPIAESAKYVYGWTDATVALLSNWGPICYIIGTPLATWVMDVKGLRWAAVGNMALVAVGTGLRCIPADIHTATWLIHTGQLLNGLAGPIAMAGAPLLSSTWFPASQRTSATAIGATFNGLGTAVSFIVGPLVVRSPSNNTINATSLLRHGDSDVDIIKWDIMTLQYGEFAWSAALLLLVLVYFPAKPPRPPSITASIARTDYKAGLKTLFTLPQFWLLGCAYGISTGVYNCWGSVLDTVLSGYQGQHITQATAGWVGFAASMSGNVAGICIGIFADIFKRHFKIYILLLFGFAIASVLIFSLSYVGIIPFSIELLYITNILAGICAWGCVPLFFELCCELSYPVAEGLTNGVLTLLNNIVGLVFLLVLMIPNIGAAWMNWTLLGAFTVCLPFLILTKEKYSRLNIDSNQL